MYQRQVTFGEAINKALAQNYCNFSGRASRSEFWWYVLFTAILGFAIGLVLGIFGAGTTVTSLVQGFISLVLLLPSLGVSVRRLHDVDKSGWWVLISLIPLVDAIVLLIWYCKDSGPANQYGPVPDMTE